MIAPTHDQIDAAAVRFWRLIDRFREHHAVDTTLHICRGMPLCEKVAAPCPWCARVAHTDDRPLSTIARSLIPTIQ